MALADSAKFAPRTYKGETHLNAGTAGRDITVRELAELIAETVRWDGGQVLTRTCPTDATQALDV
jgi:hypothetical protein